MFSNSGKETVIAEGLKIEGMVTADGPIRVHGKILGDLHGASLVIAARAEIRGTVTADRVVVDGTVDGPIRGGDVVLKSNARVKGDIHHSSLSIEKGAMFNGRSRQKDAGRKKTAPEKKTDPAKTATPA